MPLFDTPFNALDICILFLFIGGILGGYKQGFVLSFFKFFGTIISIILTRMYYDEFVLFLQNVTPVQTWITRFYESHLEDFFTKGIASKPELYKMLPFGKDLGQLQAIFIHNQTAMESSINTYLVSHLTTLSMNLVSLVLLFFLILLGMQVLILALDIAAKLPIIKGLNKLGGLLFGFIKMFILISIGLVLVVALASLSKTGLLANQLEFSLLAPYFMRYNVLLLFIGSTLMGI